MRTQTQALFQEDDVGEAVQGLRINKEYAKRYAVNKDREELHKLQSRVALNGEAVVASSSSSSLDEEDSEAELVTPVVGAKVLETISRIKFKDRAVYEKGEQARFFEERDFSESAVGKTVKKAGPVTFSSFLEGAEAFTEEEQRFEEGAAAGETAANRSDYLVEQAAVKQAFLSAAAEADQDPHEGDQLLEPAQDSRTVAIGKSSFQTFIEKRAEEESTQGSDCLNRYLHEAEALDENETFLRDFLILEGWKSSSQIAHRLTRGGQAANSLSPIDEEEEEDVMSEAERFEAAYNFRFEENVPVEIQGHARRVLDSVRAKDEKRRLHRLAKEARKKAEKEEQMHDLARLKELKRKELVERLRIIQKIAGVRSVALENLVGLDGDFDEQQHEQQMQAILGEDYEQQEEREAPKALLQIPEELREPEIPASAATSNRMRRRLERLRKMQDKTRQSAAVSEEEAYAPEAEGGQRGVHDETPSTSRVDADQEMEKGGHVVAWYLCDGCGFGIKPGRRRYDCQTCDNFTLCGKCFRCVRHPHMLKKRKVPEHCKPPKESLEPAETVNDESGDVPPAGETGNASILQDVLDEYYAMDYEDIIGGDLPVRFKYTKVKPNSFGLTVEDIMQRPDKELNQFISIKRLAPYAEKEPVPNKFRLRRRVSSPADNCNVMPCVLFSRPAAAYVRTNKSSRAPGQSDRGSARGVVPNDGSRRTPAEITLEGAVINSLL